MKKTLMLILIIIFMFMSIPICKGDFFVQPREISITMSNEFVHGNTSKKIMITNNNNYSTNISWYLEHPNPISWMRPNKTFIPTLSYIDLNPKCYIIPPNDTISFYIYLDIPESEENLEQDWETWVTFKEENQESMFNQEHAVRVYIDTPMELANSNNYSQYDSSMQREDHINVTLLAISISIVFTIILFALVILTFKKKKS